MNGKQIFVTIVSAQNIMMNFQNITERLLNLNRLNNLTVLVIIVVIILVVKPAGAIVN